MTLMTAKQTGLWAEARGL